MDDEMIAMTRAQFETIWDALAMANSPYSDDDETLATLVAKERAAYEVAREVRHSAGLPALGPASGDVPKP
jgi:hypothetical protein